MTQDVAQRLNEEIFKLQDFSIQNALNLLQKLITDGHLSSDRACYIYLFDFLDYLNSPQCNIQESAATVSMFQEVFFNHRV